MARNKRTPVKAETAKEKPEEAREEAPKLEAEVPPAKRVTGKSKVTDKPLRRRRQPPASSVTLRTFIRACSTPDDQLAGFSRWAQKQGLTKNTMKGWQEILEKFQKTPAGN